MFFVNQPIKSLQNLKYFLQTNTGTISYKCIRLEQVGVLGIFHPSFTLEERRFYFALNDREAKG